MAKFCTRCGKELEDGKLCDCAKILSNTRLETDVLNTFVDVLKGIFTKPVDTMKKYVNASNALIALIALAINIIITGVFYYCLLNKGLGLFDMGSVSSFSSLSFEVPFFETFIHGIVFILSWFLVAICLIYVIANPILKDKIDIKTSFSLVGICSMFTTITTILALIFVYINVDIMLFILAVGASFYLTYIYQGLSELTNIDKNKLAYVFVPALLVATYVMVYIVPKIFS